MVKIIEVRFLTVGKKIKNMEREKARMNTVVLS